MTKVKKLVAAVVAAISLGAIGVGAFAATEDARATNAYLKFDEIKLSERGGHYETDALQKTNTLSRATVYFTGGSISSLSPVNYRVIDEDGNSVSEVQDPVTNFGKYEPKYKAGKGVQYDFYKLYLNAGYNGVTVSGQWQA